MGKRLEDLPVEVLLEIIYGIKNVDDIRHLCKGNKRISKICNENKYNIARNYLKNNAITCELSKDETITTMRQFANVKKNMDEFIDNYTHAFYIENFDYLYDMLDISLSRKYEVLAKCMIKSHTKHYSKYRYVLLDNAIEKSCYNVIEELLNTYDYTNIEISFFISKALQTSNIKLLKIFETEYKDIIMDTGVAFLMMYPKLTQSYLKSLTRAR